jgi:hypothetical protein
MPDIHNSVGVGGANSKHDVAMVQAMLKIIKNAKNQSYLKGNYDGVYGNDTKQAIIAFQADYNLVPATPLPGKDKQGMVVKAGKTIQKLTQLLPADRKGLSIVKDTNTVYIEDSTANKMTSRSSIDNDQDLDTTFRANVAKLVDTMYLKHKIVLWVTPTGRHRTFAQQANPALKTNAGPGESNHNFGRAVDIGFKNFKWLQGNGTIYTDDYWLNRLKAVSVQKATAFWDTRDTIALNAPLNLHRLQMERIHLQSYDQAKASSSRSLADLLSRVGTMKWKERYKCDLGSKGANYYPVGSAKTIWAGNASVSKAEISAAKGVPVNTITANNVNTMQKALKGDFELAETNWKQWKPIP